mmetsp:Transcript_45704/g.52833  ORF Transcript_45704/g.52833 Transcript_45704/m.52833 type:complete len:113 (-) Transcript_45704:137-475(-)
MPLPFTRHVPNAVCHGGSLNHPEWEVFPIRQTVRNPNINNRRGKLSSTTVAAWANTQFTTTTTTITAVGEMSHSACRIVRIVVVRGSTGSQWPPSIHPHPSLPLFGHQNTLQ